MARHRARRPSAVRSQSRRSDGVSTDKATRRRAAVRMATRIAHGSSCQRAGSPIASWVTSTGGRQSRNPRRFAICVRGKLQMVGDRTPGRECSEQTVRRRLQFARVKRQGGDLPGRLVDHGVEPGDSRDHRPSIVRDATCAGPVIRSARMRPPAMSADRPVSNAASRCRAPPRSVIASTRPALTMPIQISDPRREQG